MSDNIQIIENGITERLKETTDFTGFDILPYPTDIRKFDFVSAKGCLLVRYDASEYTKPQTLACVTQDETLEFTVFIALRYLKKYSDSYKYLKALKSSLTGLSIKGKRLYPIKRTFVDLVKGDLYWGYTFQITLPTAENITLKNVIPLWEQKPI